MSYYFSKKLAGTIESVRPRVEAALKSEGFGVLTEIDIAATMKKKLDADMPPYLILGACNPKFAHQALAVEDKIGTMLPCNVILRQSAEGEIEVAAVDPMASMQAVENDALAAVAGEVRAMLERVVDSL